MTLCARPSDHPSERWLVLLYVCNSTDAALRWSAFHALLAVVRNPALRVLLSVDDAIAVLRDVAAAPAASTSAGMLAHLHSAVQEFTALVRMRCESG